MTDIHTTKKLVITEPILTVNKNRFVLFPIQYYDIYKIYKDAVASFWVPDEISLEDDRRDWDKLTNDERHFISHVLAFFASSDGIVNENLVGRFMNEIQIPEGRAFFGFQIAMENIHNEMYSLLIDTLIKNAAEKSKLFNAIETIPSVAGKAEWALKWITNDGSFGQRLIAFAIVECIFFSGSFCSIFWLKKRGLMPGLCFSNELISRDEAMHVKFACMLYNMLENRLDENVVHDMIKEALVLEKEFIIDALPARLLGMNSQLMSDYIEYVADYLLSMLGYKKLYFTINPFDWMELISLQGKTNFFEKRVGEYAKSGVSLESKEGDQDLFTIDSDF